MGLSGTEASLLLVDSHPVSNSHCRFDSFHSLVLSTISTKHHQHSRANCYRTRPRVPKAANSEYLCQFSACGPSIDLDFFHCHPWQHRIAVIAPASISSRLGPSHRCGTLTAAEGRAKNSSSHQSPPLEIVTKFVPLSGLIRFNPPTALASYANCHCRLREELPED